LAEKVTLVYVTSALLHGTKSDFLDFPGEATPAPRDKTAKLAELSETTVQVNSLRGCDPPQAVGIPQLLRETSGIQPREKVQKDCTNEVTSPDPDEVNYARPLKVTKVKRFFKRGLLHLCFNI
jgi:hypothetical protein